MTKVATYLAAGILTVLTMLSSAWAGPVISPAVSQYDKLMQDNPGLTNVHGWHCQERRSHVHPDACGDTPYYDDPFEDPLYDPTYDNGVPNFVISPKVRRRANRGNCPRRVRRGCNRRWSGQPGRRARCLRKYNCR